MGTYQSNFDGCFDVDLSRDWQPTRGNSSTSIAQSRAIYINLER